MKITIEVPDAEESRFLQLVKQFQTAKVTTDPDATLTEEDIQCREVFAQFGLASYFAQCFEKGLTAFLLFRAPSTFKPRNYHKEEVEQMLDDYDRALHKKTLGQLLKELEKAGISYDDTFEQIIKQAQERRNFLIHNYFWERSEDHLSTVGRKKMLKELNEMQDLFRRADLMVKAMYKALAEAVGMPWSVVEEEMEAMLERAKKLDESVEGHPR